MSARGVVGRYRLGDVLGTGSFATVYRATDDRLQAEVVVKILAENHSLNPEIRERFIAEGRSLRKVTSAHVVAVHDIGESDHQQPFLVLEHANRGTLADRIDRLKETGDTLTRDDVLAICRDLAAALGAVHAAGLVHRDLSPRNVLIATRPAPATGRGTGAIAADEILIVADLGMCKDLALNSGLTVAGGTAGFRPPEQTGGPAVIDHRADLWAMSQLVSWATAGADLPRRFRAVLDRSLATDPRARHADARAWLAEVEAALATTAPAPPRRGPWPAVWVAAGLTLAFLAGTLAPTWVAGLTGGGDSAITIEGPSDLRVGETARFRAVAPGLDHWVWVLPNGSYVVDDLDVTLTPTRPGSAEVLLQGRDGDGRAVTTTKRVTVE